MGALGVIGGSGVYRLEGVHEGADFDVETPFGKPSALVRSGKIGDCNFYFLPRHGEGHVYSPSDVPYRANIHALKQLGVTHVLGLSAVGSLREDLPPRTLFLPDQIIDRTVLRPRTFFEHGVVAHVGIADPYCACLQEAVAQAARKVGQSIARGGAYICIEGPQFSTRAESTLYRSWGAAVIGMTAMPEARLAREAELCYATLAMVTDYDVWHETEADVSVDVVLSHLQANSAAAGAVLQRLAEDGVPDRRCHCGAALDGAIVTAPERIAPQARERIALLIGDRLQRG
jgi:5'-methylthioadenosine phosphorylase